MLVENKKVESAMVKFGRALELGSVGQQLQQQACRCCTSLLNPPSLTLVHACRDSLEESSGVKQWCNPPSLNGEPAWLYYQRRKL